MATKSPLARVKEEFGGKDKLVDKIVGLIGSQSEDESKDDLRRRLLGAANRKLVRLHGIATQLKENGGRDQVAAAAAQELGHGKDKDFVTKLSTYTSGRVLDVLGGARRRNKAKAAKSAGKPAVAAKSKSAAKPTTKKPAAKKPAAQKSA